jgi:hypothetical protein
VKNCNERKIGKRIFGLMSSEEGRAFFGKGCCEKKHGCQAAKKKKVGEIFQKLDARYFCQRKLFWDTPVYHV